MTMNLPRGNEVDPGQRCPGTTNHHVNASNAAPGQSLPRGGSLSQVHVNRPLDLTLMDFCKQFEHRKVCIKFPSCRTEEGEFFYAV